MLDLDTGRAKQQDGEGAVLTVGPRWSHSLFSHPRGPRGSAGSSCPWSTSGSHQMKEGLTQNKSGLVVSGLVISVR